MVIKKKTTAEQQYEELSRKWAFAIIKDIFLGAKRFNDFLEMNPHLSGKVLSDQLKRLEKNGYIEKIVVSTTPLRAEYELTERGYDLNKVLYEMMVYAKKYWLTEAECEHFKDKNLKKIFGI